MKGINVADMEKINNRKDELGAIGKAFSQLIKYLQTKRDIAQTIAAGNLAIEFESAGEQDGLGNAFVEMIANLRDLLKKRCTQCEIPE